MPDRNEGDFSAAFLLLCEGPEDVCFFRAVLDEHADIPPFNIRHSGKDRWDTGGNMRFGERLSALRVNRSFRELIKKILIVTDSDADPAAAYQKVRAQVGAAGYAIPSNVRETADGDPSVCIMTVPFDRRGNLECILAPATRQAKPQITACVDKFVECVTALDHWEEEQQCKLWLRAMMAARWRHDPGINIAPLFRSAATTRIIPPEDQAFNELANFIKAFSV